MKSTKSKSKKKKQDLKAAEPVGPDPVEIERQRRLERKYRRLEELNTAAQRLDHSVYDKCQINGKLQAFVSELENEIVNEIKPYTQRQKELCDEQNERFANNASRYATFLNQQLETLKAKYDEVMKRLNDELGRLTQEEERLVNKLQKLQYLKALKEQQEDTIANLQKAFKDARVRSINESQTLRLRHAKWRVREKQNQEHKLQVVSEHLQKETEPYFIFRLESKCEDNRRLLAEIANRVASIKRLQKLSDELDEKSRELVFYHAYLLQYKAETASYVKRMPPITDDMLAKLQDLNLQPSDLIENHAHALLPSEKAHQGLILTAKPRPTVTHLKDAQKKLSEGKRSETSFYPPQLFGIPTQKAIQGLRKSVNSNGAK